MSCRSYLRGVCFMLLMGLCAPVLLHGYKIPIRALNDVSVYRWERPDVQK